VLKRFIYLLLIPAGLFIINSCEPTPCLKKPVTFIGFEFYDKASEKVLIKNFVLGKFTIKQNGVVVKDSIGKAVSGFRIELPTESGFVWLGFSDSTGKDSIRLSYNKKISFTNESCGFYYGFSGLKIDSLKGDRLEKADVISDQGDSTKKTHVRIFW